MNTVGNRRLYGAVEAGGTKVNLAVGASSTDIVDIARIETRGPVETNGAIRAFFERYRAELVSIGVASFGPVRLDQSAWDWGRLLGTPKSGWSGESFVRPLAEAFALPVGLDTDVGAAALAEHRLGALQGVSCGVYLTVGTGIGAGVVVDGASLHGHLHPEAGHIRIVRAADDADFPGVCPYHGDCLEGLASGPAVERRWGASLSQLPSDHPAHGIVTGYLGQACATLSLTLSPGRIVIGGGVSKAPRFHQSVAACMRAQLSGYLADQAAEDPNYITAPALLDRAGLVGALLVAEGVLPAVVAGSSSARRE